MSALVSQAGLIPSLRAVHLAALLACTVPPLLAYNLTPSSTLINQALAFGLWGVLVMALGPRGDERSGVALRAALLLVALAALGSWSLGTLPASLMALGVASLLGAAAVAAAGGWAARQAQAEDWWDALCAGLLAAALLSAVVGLLQVFAPQLTDNPLVAGTSLEGRAAGNLRQPNHLSSLLLWGLAAAAYRHERGTLPAWSHAALSALLVTAVALTGSRTGGAGLLLLLLWGLLDRRLKPAVRATLVGAGLLYGVLVLAMMLGAGDAHHSLGAASRLAGDGASADHPSRNSRLNIWANTLALIGQQPWLGVGFGEFNLAWSLTPFAGRPTAFFDHSHNLVLQLMVELGVPLALLVLGLLGLALWQAWRRSLRTPGAKGAAGRSALVVVGLIGLHSLVEYPLWYSYFMLPSAFALGFALGLPTGGISAPPRPPAGLPWGLAAGLAMLLGGMYALTEYFQVMSVYRDVPGDARPLAQRIAQGQDSWLYAHHADYAAATNRLPPLNTALGMARGTHSLLDTRLMRRWAQHLAAHGELDLARGMADRLREFNYVATRDWMAVCRQPQPPASAFQCQPQQQPAGWRDYIAASQRLLRQQQQLQAGQSDAGGGAPLGMDLGDPQADADAQAAAGAVDAASGGSTSAP